MQELAVYEAKTRLSELLVEVEKGEQFVITRRGVAVARLVSAAPEATRLKQASTQSQKVADTFAALNALRVGTSLDLPLRDAIEQGRD
jgi:prevent-host-death family protein